MKAIKIFLVVLLTVAFASCSSGYDQSKADALVEKINSGETLSQKEIGEAISLCASGCQKLSDMIEKAKDMNDEEKEEYGKSKDEEFNSLFMSITTLHLYLNSHKADFDEANSEAFDNYKEMEKKLGEKLFGR